MFPSPFIQATLIFGGNEGAVLQAFGQALSSLNTHPQIKDLKTSSVYRTPPWGYLHQADFLNLGLCFFTSLSPQDLMTLCLDLEQQNGRNRTKNTSHRWGPRVLDIDIITYGTLNLEEPNLIVPHPQALQRAFVLLPLQKILPNLQIGEVFIASALQRLNHSSILEDKEATHSLEQFWKKKI